MLRLIAVQYKKPGQSIRLAFAELESKFKTLCVVTKMNASLLKCRVRVDTHQPRRKKAANYYDLLRFFRLYGKITVLLCFNLNRS
jgi:hypothetical protein